MGSIAEILTSILMGDFRISDHWEMVVVSLEVRGATPWLSTTTDRLLEVPLPSGMR
jgi:hypothetical protein